MSQILVVEDNELILSFVAGALEGAGHEVSVAAEAFAAERLTHDHDFELIITDVSMPGRDGLTLMQRVMGYAPDTRFIVMSGGTFGLRDCLSVALELGAHAVLPKPFTLDALLRSVGRVLGSGATVLPAAQPVA